MAFHNHIISHEMVFQEPNFAEQPLSLSASDNDDAGVGAGAPTWLNNSVFRQHNLLHLLSESEPQNDDVLAGKRGGDCGDRRSDRRREDGFGDEEDDDDEEVEDGESEGLRYKADILRHPLYEQLLSAHVSCLRIATPVDQLPRIDEQLSQSQRVVRKYSELGTDGGIQVVDEKELDQFMTNYVILLCSLKQQLQQHVRVHAMEAVMACWELEQALQSLTGVSPGEGTGATMSDDIDDQVDSDMNFYDGSLDGHDSMGFGPLIPTETERSLMERVREELKHELKQGYKEKIVDIREEIIRKRKAGKLPGDTTSLLKAWWQSHSKWPYPTEEDKARLVQETGLQLKQINNWFINQRKRNWHNNLSPSPSLKSKRKR
ncbi:Homeobox protein knotted-1-like 3 [Morus notabilis]|uniref:Homeobox protein knotted-1-like 3 n=2 Tax=Morus notabilis TaxID=981085 RepID=W9RSQ8_9ROSA|nr:homeobox protein knotted-1-like 2 isoform X3 [Morus notabilis]XP_024027716.1 homeobox protein knotted-1-like 2 isoform X2 [Morus notabilis]XP_024027717.1 homeobox protein knotted-1-like 2 isoform X2 [Morus notabilis]EXC06932.1 Homeobox protein knotted-1-like 3 [Morus notabilis]